MNRIETKLKACTQANKTALMTHVVAGYPSIEETRKLILMMVEEGVDMIEIQIPFSDPLGDGTTIRLANTASLEQGFLVAQAFDLVKTLRKEDGVEIPLLFMTYMNIPYAYGLEKFCKDAVEVGIDGLIIPDYSFTAEPYDHFLSIARAYKLGMVAFATFLSSDEHIAHINKSNTPFVYCFARQGITGAVDMRYKDVCSKMAILSNKLTPPTALGFGISNQDQVKELSPAADMLIVGSAVIDAYNGGGLLGAQIKVQELRRALST